MKSGNFHSAMDLAIQKTSSRKIHHNPAVMAGFFLPTNYITTE